MSIAYIYKVKFRNSIYIYLKHWIAQPRFLFDEYYKNEVIKV